MNSFLKGFMSLFSWMDTTPSPKERVEEMLDEFYNKYPWIERDDRKALEKDFQAIWENTK